MFAFKVVVSTLLFMMISGLIWVGLSSKDKNGKIVATVMAIVNMLSFMAIWG